jgi:phenylpropionate dioxygenase-like ring-hydroxylating dioxygenase large terminal subunit
MEEGSMSFARDCWYAAIWSSDLGRSLIARRYLNEPVVLYRKEDGTPVALADACPHRFAPLSMGILHGDEVECLYHGLRFDCSGRCTDNPNGAGQIPAAAKVRTYPLHEAWGMVWIWMGDPAAADPGLIPEFPWMTDTANYAAIHGYLHIEASYLLMLDNLTDLSHASFIHVKTLEPREMAREIFKVSEENGTLWTRLTCAGMTTPAFFAAVPGMPDRVDHWLEMRCDPPGAMVTIYGVTREGDTREAGWNTCNPNLITPETEWTTHYFWGSARDFQIEDAELSATLLGLAELAFMTEDKPIIEAQQIVIGKRDMMDLRPVLLPNDNSSGRARRAIDRMLAAEMERPAS